MRLHCSTAAACGGLPSYPSLGCGNTFLKAPSILDASSVADRSWSGARAVAARGCSIDLTRLTCACKRSISSVSAPLSYASSSIITRCAARSSIVRRGLCPPAGGYRLVRVPRGIKFAPTDPVRRSDSSVCEVPSVGPVGDVTRPTPSHSLSAGVPGVGLPALPPDS